MSKIGRSRQRLLVQRRRSMSERFLQVRWSQPMRTLLEPNRARRCMQARYGLHRVRRLRGRQVRRTRCGERPVLGDRAMQDRVRLQRRQVHEARGGRYEMRSRRGRLRARTVLQHDLDDVRVVSARQSRRRVRSDRERRSRVLCLRQQVQAADRRNVQVRARGDRRTGVLEEHAHWADVRDAAAVPRALVRDDRQRRVSLTLVLRSRARSRPQRGGPTRHRLP